MKSILFYKGLVASANYKKNKTFPKICLKRKKTYIKLLLFFPFFVAFHVLIGSLTGVVNSQYFVASRTVPFLLFGEMKKTLSMDQQFYC